MLTSSLLTAYKKKPRHMDAVLVRRMRSVQLAAAREARPAALRMNQLER
jgi:hypothetical protein